MSDDSNAFPLVSGKRARRDFLSKALGIGAGAVGLTGAGKPAVSTPPRRLAPLPVPGITDIDILNFALNLEYLEAEYYAFATTGKCIEAAGIAVTGVNTGGGNPGPIAVKAKPMVPFASATVQQYANEIAADERQHVIFLRGVLGGLAVARPAVDLLNSFAALGALIGVPNFDPFASDVNFLIGAYIFEDVGVSAFHGASSLLASKAYLNAAAGILAVEGEHAGLVRTNLLLMGQGPVTDAISTVRRSLGGGVDYGVDDGPLGQAPGSSSVFLSDTNGMASARTARQVLNILYGGVNAASGLFFPMALNGKIR